MDKQMSKFSFPLDHRFAMMCDLPTYLRRQVVSGEAVYDILYLTNYVSYQLDNYWAQSIAPLPFALGGSRLAGFGPLGSIFRATATAFGHTVTIQRTTYNVITHARKVLHAPTTNKYN